MNANSCTDLLRILIPAILFAAFSIAEAAHIISVDFYAGQPASSRLSSTDVAGVLPVANWNGIAGSDGTSTILGDSAGVATPVTLNSWFSNNDEDFILPASPTTTQVFFSSYIESQFSGNVGFSVGNIDFDTYDLYVYVMSGNAGRRGYVTTSESGTPDYYYQTAGGVPTSFIQINSTTSASYDIGNYVVFSGLTDASQTVLLQGLNSWSGIAGFQILNTTVPEPSQSVLCLLGGMSLCLLRRRTRRRY